MSILEFELEDGTKLYDLFNRLKLLDEANLGIYKDCIHIREMDPSQISLVDVKIPKTWFKKYKLLKKKDTFQFNLDNKPVRRHHLFQIDLNLFRRACNRHFLKGEVKGIITEDRLIIKVKRKGYESTTRLITLKQPIDQSLPKLPTIDYEVSFTYKSKELRSLLNEARTVSNHLQMSVSDSLHINSVDGDGGDKEIIVPAKITRKKDSPKSSEAKFSIDYLQLMLPNTMTPLKLRIRTDSPIEISYTVDDIKHLFYLAPRIGD